MANLSKWQSKFTFHKIQKKMKKSNKNQKILSISLNKKMIDVLQY